MTSKSKQETKQNNEQEQAIEQLSLIARGRVNVDQNNEMQVISRCDNMIATSKSESDESETRLFDESLAHQVARVVKYVDSLELLDQNDEQLIKIELSSETDRELVELSKSTSLYLDKIESERNFQVTIRGESETIESETRDWKYRRDERRIAFVDQLKQAIDKLDSSLVSIRKVSTMSQEEIDLLAQIKEQQEAIKKMRAQLKKAKSERATS